MFKNKILFKMLIQKYISKVLFKNPMFKVKISKNYKILKFKTKH